MASTIRDIAREAGVSTAAVSKVLHGGGTTTRVSPASAERIREIAQRLEYRPNALARNLRRRQTRTIGLLFENFNAIADGPLYYAHLLDGIGSVLYRKHYRLTILPELPEAEVLGSLSDGQIDGVIWCKLARQPDTLDLIRACPIPIVALNAGHPEDVREASFVGCDNDGGTHLAMEHLWDLGHRHVLFVNEREEDNTPDCVARRTAYRRWVEDKGATAETRTWSWEAEELADWSREPGRATAILCWTEGLAGRMLAQAQRSGLEVPRDFSLVGYDSTRFCETTTPRLTAVRQPITEMAAHAAHALLDLVENGGVRTSIIFPCSLDVRDSTSAPQRCHES